MVCSLACLWYQSSVGRIKTFNQGMRVKFVGLLYGAAEKEPQRMNKRPYGLNVGKCERMDDSERVIPSEKQ